MKYDLHEVADGVWAAIVDDDRPAVGNAAIVDAGDETIVFDTTLSFELAARLRADAKRLTGWDPAVLVNSHWHGDHTLGNQASRACGSSRRPAPGSWSRRSAPSARVLRCRPSSKTSPTLTSSTATWRR